jgi:hypothetical protein
MSEHDSPVIQTKSDPASPDSRMFCEQPHGSTTAQAVADKANRGVLEAGIELIF